MLLRTERLILRPLEVGDAADLWPFVSDPEVPRYMTWDAHLDLSETKSFLASMENGRLEGTNLALAMVRGGSVIGVVGLHDITRDFRAWQVDRAELGYWVGPPHQGQGYVSEAARELVRYAFTEMALHKVTVGCLEENVGSRRVIEKLGFRFLGTQRDHAFRFGRWWDHRAYELTEPEWLQASLRQ